MPREVEYRNFYDLDDNLSPPIYVPSASRRDRYISSCSPDDAKTFVDALTNDHNVSGVSLCSIKRHGKSRGGRRVSGKNKDNIDVSVVMLLKEVSQQCALDNNLEAGVVYAEIKSGAHSFQRGKHMIETMELIIPLLKMSDEPAVEALGDLHYVSEEHFAELAVGIKTAIAMSGKPKPIHKPKVRKPKMKTLVECDKVQADNLDERTADRLAVMDFADELGVQLPIGRNPTPKSQKDAAKERQQSRYNEDGEDYVFLWAQSSECDQRSQ
jgi:hypothetical protein